MSPISNHRLIGLAILGVIAGAAIAPRCRGDQIVLRNFDVLRNVTVERFDEDGARLDDGKIVTWDQIEAATVEKDGDAFNKMLKELGDPLYRIRQRLSIGDYRGLLNHAEKIESRFLDRTSDAAYWVSLGLMWGRIADGRREEAVAPYLRCYEIHRVRADMPPKAPGQKQLVIDAQTGLCPELTPIWFNTESAKAAMPKTLAAVSAMKEPRPASTRIYYGSLAIAAGDLSRANQVLNEPLDGTTESLRQVLLAQLQIQAGNPEAAYTALRTQYPDLPVSVRPLAIYWIGFAQTSSSEEMVKRDGLLNLMRLPASFGEKQPVLAAAGLHRAIGVLDALGDAGGSVRVRRELLEQYGQTYHAGLEKSPQNTTEEEP